MSAPLSSTGSGPSLHFDIVAGLTAAAVVLPKAMTYATEAGLPVAIGRKRDADVLRPISAEHPDDETFDGLLILRPEGRIFFVNAQSIAEQIRTLVAKYQPKVVTLDLSRVPDIEYSALKMRQGGDQRIAGQGITLWLAALNPRVLEVVRHAGMAEQLGRERLLFNARAAIEKYQSLPAAGSTTTAVTAAD